MVRNQREYEIDWNFKKDLNVFLKEDDIVWQWYNQLNADDSPEKYTSLTQLEKGIINAQNVQDIKSNYIINIAARYGRIDIAKALVKKFGQEILNATLDFKTGAPIFCAAFSGHVEFAKFLVEKLGPEVLKVKDYHGALPIHTAAEGGQVAFAEWLVDEMGQDINVGNKYDMEMPAHLAARFNHIDFIKWLDNREQDLTNCPKRDGTCGTPLRVAIQSGSLDVVKWLLEKNYNLMSDDIDETPIELAIRYGHYDLYKWFVENPTYRRRGKYFDQGMNALHIAARYGRIWFIEAYYSNNSDKEEFEMMDNNGWMPIHYAATHGDKDVVKFLVCKHGVEQLTQDDRTLLHLCNLSSTAEFLVTKNSDLLYKRCQKGWLPIHYALERGYLLLVKWYADKMLHVSDARAVAQLKMEDLNELAVTKSGHFYELLEANKNSRWSISTRMKNGRCFYGNDIYNWWQSFVGKINEHYTSWIFENRNVQGEEKTSYRGVSR